MSPSTAQVVSPRRMMSDRSPTGAPKRGSARWRGDGRAEGIEEGLDVGGAPPELELTQGHGVIAHGIHRPPNEAVQPLVPLAIGMHVITGIEEDGRSRRAAGRIDERPRRARRPSAPGCSRRARARRGWPRGKHDQRADRSGTGRKGSQGGEEETGEGERGGLRSCQGRSAAPSSSERPPGVPGRGPEVSDSELPFRRRPRVSPSIYGRFRPCLVKAASNVHRRGWRPAESAGGTKGAGQGRRSRTKAKRGQRGIASPLPPRQRKRLTS